MPVFPSSFVKRIAVLVVLTAVLAGGLLLWTSFQHRSASKGTRNAKRGELLERLDRVIVPSVDFREISLKDAIREINNLAAEAGLCSGKEMVIYWQPGDPIPHQMRELTAADIAVRSANAPMIPGLEPLPPAELKSLHPISEAPKTVTANLKNIPLGELTRYIAAWTDHGLREAQGQILVYPKAKLAIPLVAREFFLANARVAEWYLDIPAGTTAKRVDIREKLRREGVAFCPESYAHYEPRDWKVVVCVDENEMEIVETIFSGSCVGIPSFDSPWERRQSAALAYWYRATSFLRSSYP